MKPDIDRLVDSLVQIPDGSGLVVGVLQGERREVYSYSLLSKADQPAGDTVYEIGSISKVFTTSAFATMLNEGLLKLDAPVFELVPVLTNLPAEITLLTLATHTSGLPKMPSNVLPKMLRNRRNPYVDYSAQDMLRYLSRCNPSRLKKRIGRIEYSNLGIGLLGFILAQKMGVPFEQVIVKRICEPLGMHDSRINLSPGMKTHLAPPLLANGKAASSWDMPAFEGAGGMRSTANDTIKFLQANVGLTDLHLASVLQTCHEPRETNFAPLGSLQALISRQAGRAGLAPEYRQAVGLGWVVGRLRTDGSLVHWHHGATGGYRAFVGFVKSKRTAVVVFANTRPSTRDLITSTTSTDALGFEVLEYLCSRAQSH